MGFYIGLLVLIYLVYFLAHIGSVNEKKANDAFLVVVFLILYFFCVLRDFSVGSDIMGYSVTYDKAGDYDWFDDSWTFMEPGYVFLMKLCNTLGLSSRGFFYVIYIIMLYPVYKTIKRYSKDPLLSVITFVCFQYFVFYLTGLRQAIAMSIGLLTIPYALRQTKKDWIIMVSLILLAMSCHMSSIVFFALPVIFKMKYGVKNISLVIVAILFLPFFTQALLGSIRENEMGGYTYNESAVMGMGMVFFVLVAIFLMVSTSQSKVIQNNITAQIISLPQYSMIMLAAVAMSFFFNGTTLLRATMFYTMSMMCSLPMAISVYPKDTRVVLNVIIHIFMIYMLFGGELIPNHFNVVNYKIASDLSIFK